MFKNTVHRLGEGRTPSHIENDGEVIANIEALIAAKHKIFAQANGKRANLLDSDVKEATETHHQRLLSAAASTPSTPLSDSTSTPQTRSSVDSVPPKSNADLQSNQLNTIRSLQALTAALAETHRRLTTPLDAETVRSTRPRAGSSSSEGTAEIVDVRLGTQTEDFAARVVREKGGVEALWPEREAIVRKTNELKGGEEGEQEG
ncbi:MAG: hypothetical protein M1822_001362 [Bathelium mastoideum]|nr:MAG: hypothetical protein M1822_001362 [Bathelium mastoideum]